MRVLLISHTCQSRTEGQPKAEFLGRMPGIQLKVIVPDRWKHYGRWRLPDAPPIPGFDYHPLKVRLPWAGPAQFYLHHYPDLANVIREFQPDIIDLWEEPWGLVSVQACRLRSRLCPGARIISETEQNIDKKLQPPFEWFRSYTLKRADFAITRSNEAAQVLKSKGYKGPTAVVPNGVDADLFLPLDRQQCRRDLGISGFAIGYVGRLVEEKGVLDLVEALTNTPKACNAIFVGSGAMQKTIAEKALSLNIAERVRILPAMSLRELPPLMNALDVLTLPSRTTPRWKEQFGRVIIEANACGTPVIGSSSGAIPDVVGRGGVIVPECDPRALARAISQMSSEPDRCRATGLAGREQVEAHFTWQRVAQRMYEIYHQVADRVPPAISLISPIAQTIS